MTKSPMHKIIKKITTNQTRADELISDIAVARAGSCLDGDGQTQNV